MKCKFCEAELEEGVTLCPACGKDTAEETVCEETCQCSDECACEESENMTCECCCEESGNSDCEYDCEQTSEETEKQTCKKPKAKRVIKPLKGWRLGVVIACGAVLLCALVGAFVQFGLGINLLPKENDVFNKNSYTVEDFTLRLRSDTVVATMGDQELTNRMLQMYYQLQLSEFQQQGSSLVDFSKPLEDQRIGKQNYQQFFLNLALDNWKFLETLCRLAEEADFVMSQETQEYLDSVPEQLLEMATEDYDSLDEMLSDILCPGMTQEAYTAFLETCNYGYEYYEEIRGSIVPTQQDIEDYYTQNEAMFQQYQLTKDSGMIADVRHILLSPEGGTTENNVTTYSEDEWAACLEAAEKLLEEWKNGEATEESFAELAKEHSTDGGSSAEGGLYEGITPSTNFVPNFLNWTIDENRQVGDTGIVQSDYGYHIMYYVDGEPLWQNVARSACIEDLASKVVNDAMEQTPMEVDYWKIVLAEID